MLEGELVRLRALEPEDAPLLQSWFNDGEVTEYTSARYQWSLMHEEAWLQEAPVNSFAGVRLAVEAKDGRHIGVTELRRTRPEDRKAELSVVIGDTGYWSRGFGTDVVRTMLRHAFEDMNLHRIWLTTLEYNDRAVACYEKCGFREEGRLRDEVFKHGHFYDFIIMGVLRNEWKAAEAAAAAASTAESVATKETSNA